MSCKSKCLSFHLIRSVGFFFFSLCLHSLLDRAQTATLSNVVQCGSDSSRFMASKLLLRTDSCKMSNLLISCSRGPSHLLYVGQSFINAQPLIHFCHVRWPESCLFFSPSSLFQMFVRNMCENFVQELDQKTKSTLA